ncbi:MAG: hypothetical protein ACYCTI_00945 [Acidimicrobiales bacterium]
MWAFSDESERTGVMLIAVVVLDPGAVDAARRKLRGLLLPGQRRVHTTDESSRRQRVLLDTVADIDGLSADILRYRRPQGVDRLSGRHLLLQAATGAVVGSGVVSWVLDDQDPAQRLRDRAAIAHALAGVDRRLHPVYDHRPAHSEPLLWAADAVCWAAGAGGDWQRRLSGKLTLRDLRP